MSTSRRVMPRTLLQASLSILADVVVPDLHREIRRLKRENYQLRTMLKHSGISPLVLPVARRGKKK
jgi:hypothetical protein